MKTTGFILAVAISFIAAQANAQIKVLNTGTTYIGNTASSYGALAIDYTGYNNVCQAIYPTVSGYGFTFLGKSNNAFQSVYSYNYQTLSDARLKENIVGITNALSIVKNLNGVQYDYKATVFSGPQPELSSADKAMIDKGRKNYLGFLAQDVQKVLPQVVFHDDSTDIYSIDYTKIIPVLVEAIKEQQIKIDELSASLTLHENNLKSAEVSSSIIGTEELTPSLTQNAPNPFNASTLIAYYIPANTIKAMINIYNMNGSQIKSILLTQTGKGNITVNASELNPGMYLYTLVADGKEVDTKRMILTN